MGLLLVFPLLILLPVSIVGKEERGGEKESAVTRSSLDFMGKEEREGEEEGEYLQREED